MGNPQVGIEITARATGFQAEFQKISAQAQAASDRVSSAFGSMRTAAAALGVTLSAAGFAAFVKGAIDAADKLNDLSKVTGVGAVTLGGVGLAAAQAGTDLEGVAKAFGKMQLLIADAQAGNEKAAGTFQKLGISIGDLHSLKPDEIFAKIADAFSGYEDDANKAAGANLIFGKTWASVVPLLDEGGDSLRKNIGYFQRYSGVTDDLVRASDQFNDSMAKLKLLQGAFANQLAAQLLPSLQKMVEYLVDAKEKGDGFASVAKDIADAIKGVAVVAAYAGTYVTGIARGLGAAAAAAQAIVTLNWQGAKDVYDGLAKEQADRLANLNRVVAAIRGASPVPESMKDTRGGPGTGSGKRPTPSFGDAGGASKAEVDAFAKALDRVSKMAAEAQLELQGMFSTQEITGAQKALAQLVASDEWQKFTGQQQGELTARYQAIEAVQRETLEWKKKNEEQAKTIKLYEQEQEALVKAQQSFTESLGNYADENSIMEKQIALVGADDVARQKLAATIEYESLKKKALLADDQAGLAILEEQFQKRIGLIEQLGKATAEFAQIQQFNSIFVDAFADSLVSIVEGTKSVKDAMKDMARSIAHSINDIAAHSLAKALFGVDSQGGGGLGALFAKFFKGGGFDWASIFGSSGGGANVLQGAGGGDILTGLQGFASGGNPPLNKWSLVGERGPELIFPRRPVTVAPIRPGTSAPSLGYGRERQFSVVNNINVLPGASYQTARQAAKMAADKATLARRRG